MIELWILVLADENVSSGKWTSETAVFADSASMPSTLVSASDPENCFQSDIFSFIAGAMCQHLWHFS